MNRRRIAAVLRDESGNATVSIVFLVAALLFGGILSGTAISLVAAASTTNTSSVMAAAVDQRLGEYAGALSGPEQAYVGDTCYSTLHTCVSVTSVSSSANLQVVKLHAVNGSYITDTTRTISIQTGSHISGYDALGNPVWVTVGGGSTVFTGTRR